MQSILDAINEWIKEILIGAINGNLSTMFGDVNEKVGTIAAEVGQTPQGWNANIFSMIQTLSENVIVPIAGLVITYVKEHEQEFIETANECSAKAVQKTLTQQRKELDKAQSRISELNILFRKLYEDNALGKLSDEQFAFLTSGYDEEKKTLTRRIAELSQEIDNATERSADVKRFVALVRKYTAITELTYENVHEFIDRILIHELDKETNTRKIEIFYSFVGRVDTGDKPTESISYFRQIGADVKSYAI